MIEINNLTNFAVDKHFFTGVAKKVLKGENKETENLSVAFIGLTKIAKLNKKYRKKNKPTDVLSFSAVGGSASGGENDKNFPSDFLEVIICPKVVKEKNPNLPLKDAMTKTLIHGILHCFGYDHEKSLTEERKMSEKEEYYFAKISNIKH